MYATESASSQDVQRLRDDIRRLQDEVRGLKQREESRRLHEDLKQETRTFIWSVSAFSVSLLFFIIVLVAAFND